MACAQVRSMMFGMQRHRTGHSALRSAPLLSGPGARRRGELRIVIWLMPTVLALARAWLAMACRACAEAAGLDGCAARTLGGRAALIMRERG